LCSYFHLNFFNAAMSRLLSLLFVLLFVFDVGLVAARPQSLQHRSPDRLTYYNDSSINTNAKRFSRGLPPLAPFLKRNPTDVDTARRSQASQALQCSKLGVIKVVDAQTAKVKGYVSKHYSLEMKKSQAQIFSSTVFTSGQTVDINLRIDKHHYLAGLIRKNEQLGNGGNKNAAILGNSYSTKPGATPQSFSKKYDVETAIWTYNRNGDSLTATWVNYPGQTPSSTSTHAYWIQDEHMFYLTDSPTPPANGEAVLFEYLTTKGKCALPL